MAVPYHPNTGFAARGSSPERNESATRGGNYSGLISAPLNMSKANRQPVLGPVPSRHGETMPYGGSEGRIRRIDCINGTLIFSINTFSLLGFKVTSMDSRMLWSRILKVVGGVAMLVGTLDPMEGSVLILPGSGLVALGMYLGGKNRKTVLYWTWVFILIAVGVGAMFALSAVGGIGGKSGHSMWWGVSILPYPLGWLMALLGAVISSLRFFKAK